LWVSTETSPRTKRPRPNVLGNPGPIISYVDEPDKSSPVLKLKRKLWGVFFGFYLFRRNPGSVDSDTKKNGTPLLSPEFHLFSLETVSDSIQPPCGVDPSISPPQWMYSYRKSIAFSAGVASRPWVVDAQPFLSNFLNIRNPVFMLRVLYRPGFLWKTST